MAAKLTLFKVLLTTASVTAAAVTAGGAEYNNFYRVVKLNLTPEIEIFYIGFQWKAVTVTPSEI